MSTWYDYHITATGDKCAIAKFFNIKPEEVNFIDDFEFSFSAKNGAVPNLDKIAEKNPDLIFVVRQNIECDTEKWYLKRFDAATSEHKRVLVECCSGYGNKEVNKLILDKYLEKNPRHKQGDPINWKYFLSDFALSAEILEHIEKYEKMVISINEEDFLDDDFDHLKLEGE